MCDRLKARVAVAAALIQTLPVNSTIHASSPARLGFTIPHLKKGFGSSGSVPFTRSGEDSPGESSSRPTTWIAQVMDEPTQEVGVSTAPPSSGNAKHCEAGATAGGLAGPGLRSVLAFHAHSFYYARLWPGVDSPEAARGEGRTDQGPRG